jgi:PAS domain S-box-containing protein
VTGALARAGERTGRLLAHTGSFAVPTPNAARHALSSCLVALGAVAAYAALWKVAFPRLAAWQAHLATVVLVAAGAALVARVTHAEARRVQQLARSFHGWGERSEAALRAFVDARPEPAFLVNRQHLVLTLNQALADRLGREVDEVLGRDPFAFLPDRALAATRVSQIDQVFTTGRSMVFHDANNGRSYANHLSPVRGADGEIWAVGIIAVDVTDLRRAEAEANRKEELLRFGLEAARLGVWEWDVEADQVTVSSEATRLLGGRALARRGPLTSIVEYVEPADRLAMEEAIRGCARGLVETMRVTFRARPVRRKPIRWLEIQGRMFDTPDGGRRMVGTVADVTLQMEAEERRQRSEQELERRVAERTRELTASNRELEAFSYSVSHDLRAPLRSIDGFALALLEDHGAALPPEAQKYLEIVRSESQRMGQIIDDLLGLARITRSPLTRVAVDVSGLGGSIVEGLRRRHPEREVAVSIEPAMTGVADAKLLRIALENLIGNAWKFSGRAAAPRIEIGSEGSEDGRTTFFIRDNGAGFDAAAASNLFQPFQRLHAASEFEGHGIGLATVHRIIKRHGGTIWAESRPGEGAVFRWTLPGIAS